MRHAGSTADQIDRVDSRVLGGLTAGGSDHLVDGSLECVDIGPDSACVLGIVQSFTVEPQRRDRSAQSVR